MPDRRDLQVGIGRTIPFHMMCYFNNPTLWKYKIYLLAANYFQKLGPMCCMKLEGHTSVCLSFLPLHFTTSLSFPPSSCPLYLCSLFYWPNLELLISTQKAWRKSWEWDHMSVAPAPWRWADKGRAPCPRQAKPPEPCLQSPGAQHRAGFHVPLPLSADSRFQNDSTVYQLQKQGRESGHILLDPEPSILLPCCFSLLLSQLPLWNTLPRGLCQAELRLAWGPDPALKLLAWGRWWNCGIPSPEAECKTDG